jgi:hypothetical protein
MDFNYRFCNTPLFITTSTMRLKVGLPLEVYESVLPYSKHNTGYVLERAQFECAAGKWKSIH